MKRILVLVEPNQDTFLAVKKAVEIARAGSVGIHVVDNCYQQIDFYDSGENPKNATLKHSLINEQERWWSEHIKTIAEGLQFTYEVVWQRHIADWLSAHSQVKLYDLIVTTMGVDEIEAFSPSDWALFRESSLPVYTVMPYAMKENSGLLVALDLLSKEPEKLALNEKLLEEASNLAQTSGQELHCCYVINIPTVVFEFDSTAAEQKKEELQKQAEARGKALFEQYGLDKAHIHVDYGTPWKRIANLANKLKVNTIVLGSMGRKGISGKLFGNTSEKIIQVVRNDLLVINP